MTGERSTSPTDYASYVDATIRPQDDLFGHVNGRWLAETPIPDDRSRIGAFIDLRDLSEERVRGIITELGETTPDGDDAESVAARKIGTLYAAYMDTAAIEEAGAASTSLPASRPRTTSCGSPRTASACPTRRTTARTSSAPSARPTRATWRAC
jgi:predicted metalloendopeptidase